MNTSPPTDPHGRSDVHVALSAALAALLALSLFMAVASVAGIVPSPPHDKLPFVAGNIALVVASLVLVHGLHRATPWVTALTALSYLPSVGPHKFLTEVHAAALTPVIGVGSASILVVSLCAYALWRRGQ